MAGAERPKTQVGVAPWVVSTVTATGGRMSAFESCYHVRDGVCEAGLTKTCPVIRELAVRTSAKQVCRDVEIQMNF
jgi:hypothetical protein